MKIDRTVSIRAYKGEKLVHTVLNLPEDTQRNVLRSFLTNVDADSFVLRMHNTPWPFNEKFILIDGCWRSEFNNNPF